MSVGATGLLSKPIQRPALQEAVLPSPTDGVDGRLGLSEQSLKNAIYSYNLIPSEYGMRTRYGYREWVTNLETAGGNGSGVRSLIIYRDPGGGGDSKLFCATNEGIWDVTSSTDAPTIAASFAVNDATSGYGNYIQYTDDAGNDRVFYADESNGLYTYTPGTDTWAPETGITGVAATSLVHVVSHKQRLWFVERGTSSGWYLDIGAVTGPATQFTFGGKFQRGGELVGLYNWTLDSGSGIDDILVAVSRGGDVIPYQGDDPAQAATWTNIGTFYIGIIPKGRKIASEYGGDLRLLSDWGLVSMSDLLSGVSRTDDAQALNLKIARFLREVVNQYGNSYGFELRLNPNEGELVVNTPQRTNGVYIQYVVDFTVRGWGFWRGVPGHTFEMWDGYMAAGTLDNRVLLMDVTRDGIPIDGIGGDKVEFSILQSYSDAGAPARYKYGEFIRADLLSGDVVEIQSCFVYDYDLNTVCRQPQARIRDEFATWADVADPKTTDGIWDQDIWGGEGVGSQHNLLGGWGCGRVLAVAHRGRSLARTTLVSTDVMWRTAGRF